jgi:hypothetical protein
MSVKGDGDDVEVDDIVIVRQASAPCGCTLYSDSLVVSVSPDGNTILTRPFMVYERECLIHVEPVGGIS